MRLADLMDERGLSEADVAAVLAEKGVQTKAGNPVTETSVRLGKGKEIPKAWAAALDAPTAEGNGAPQPRSSEQPPKAPPGTTLVTSVAQSPTRIAGAYRFLGGMLAAGADSPGVARVWDDSADPIAKLWIKAAEQSPWAARFVNFMNQGGAQADLGMAHLYLAGATLYVLGANIPGGDGIFAKYRGYRPPVVIERPEAASDGAAHASAETRVGEPPG